MAEKKVRGLGSGLGKIFDTEKEFLPGSDGIRKVSIARVEPRKDQPRKEFSPDALAELTESIREYGIIQPITVRELDRGCYQIIAGERRWRAARQAGLTEVPVCVVDADDRLAMELALVENLQREDLNPVEEALGYRTLMKEYELTQDQVAARVQKSRPAVANALRLLNLEEEVLRLVADGFLSAGHARALVAIKDPEAQTNAAAQVVAKELSVRQTETMVASLLKEPVPEKEKPPVDYVKEAEKQLSDSLGRKVRFSGGTKRGRIVLEFYSPDDRELLMQALMKMEKPWKAKEDN